MELGYPDRDFEAQNLNSLDWTQNSNISYYATLHTWPNYISGTPI